MRTLRTESGPFSRNKTKISFFFLWACFGSVALLFKDTASAENGSEQGGVTKEQLEKFNFGSLKGERLK